jgi:pilus retraction protein PilT
MKLIEELILQAWNHEASDLFLLEGNPGRMKVFNRFIECGEKTIPRDSMEALWEACRTDPKVTLDRDVSFRSVNRSRWRVSLHQSCGRLAATMRQVKPSIPTFEALGLPETLLQSWLGRTSGLIFVTGPTGCGKSTTLASSLEFINSTRTGHVVTIEDPIEYEFTDRLSFFTQREVGIDTENFATGLRAALRQAPNVIMMGEIRDQESATVAVQAAETGHLVLGTLHASNVPDTLERFMRLVPATEREGLMAQLSQQLIGIFAQQLVKGIAKRSVVPICEYLTVGGAVREWLRENAMDKVRDYMKRGQADQCQTQQQALADAYNTEKVSYEEVMAHAQNPTELDRAIRGIS